MRLNWRGAILAAATLGCFWTDFAKAGDDGAAPIWVGIGSIFAPALGIGKEEAPPIDYREHGKLVLPPNTDLPQPGAAASSATDWPVNQEVVRKKLAKEQAKEKQIAGQGDARLRYTHPFPNAPVTIQAPDQPGAANDKVESSSVLGNLNPMSWVGMGKKVPIGPEPDREWLTDPPQGYRAAVGPEGQSGH